MNMNTNMITVEDIVEGMTLTDNLGDEWYVSFIDENGTIWLDSCQHGRYTPAKEIRTDRDLKGFKLV